VFACLLFNAKIPRKVSQPSKHYLFISKPKFHLLSKQHKNLILAVREGFSPRRAFLADRLAIHGSPETTFAVPMIWRESRGHFTVILSRQIFGAYLLSLNRTPSCHGILGRRQAFCAIKPPCWGGGVSIDTKLVGERPILCSSLNSSFKNFHQIAHRASCDELPKLRSLSCSVC